MTIVSSDDIACRTFERLVLYDLNARYLDAQRPEHPDWPKDLASLHDHP